MSDGRMKTVSIRDAVLADAEAIAALLAALGYPATSEEARSHIERFSVDPASRIQVAIAEGDEVVGLVATHLVPRLNRELYVCRVTELVVDPSSRRSGIGRTLIAAAEDEARDRETTLMDLTSGDWRGEAHSFYPDAGFERVGVGYRRRLDP